MFVYTSWKLKHSLYNYTFQMALGLAPVYKFFPISIHQLLLYRFQHQSFLHCTHQRGKEYVFQGGSSKWNLIRKISIVRAMAIASGYTE